jgi:cyclophilin family peptidyl-prolyl cis-trans isomerase
MASPEALPKPVDPIYVKLELTDGDVYLELDQESAPQTVENFVKYVADGHYDGTIFHRVIPGFVVQGGGYTTGFTEKETREPVRNESRNGLSNVRGALAMARTADPHSARAQWYVNLADNVRLDASEYRWGYTVFGKVVFGMEVFDEIARIPTGPAGPFGGDVPFRPVVVRKASVETELPVPEEEPVAVGAAKKR